MLNERLWLTNDKCFAVAESVITGRIESRCRGTESSDSPRGTDASNYSSKSEAKIGWRNDSGTIGFMVDLIVSCE